MFRSAINEIIKYTIDKMNFFKIPLPPFAYYSINDWINLDKNQEELCENMLGWDVTDFGTGDFIKCGLTVFTFRNGNVNIPNKYKKTYCEKLLFVREGQILPYHFHWKKTEDIINRGGGNLEIKIYQSDVTEKKLDCDVIVSIDGKKTSIPAGGSVILKPGESVTLYPYQYHTWKGVEGTGDIALFEVSTTNDDRIDNRFYEANERIPNIIEDVAPEYLIFKDYNKYVKFLNKG